MAAKKSLVTLNIGSQRVTMGVFQPGAKGSLLLRRYASVDLMADPAADASRGSQVRAAVENLSSQLKVSKASVRYAIPGRTAFMRFVKLPPLGEDNVGQIVEFEAQQNVPFPIDEVVWDYQLIGEDNSAEVEAVIVAVKSETLDEINEAVDGAMKPEAVDAAPMAIYNAFRFNYADLTAPSLIIDIGARSTNLIYIDGDRVFARNSTSVGGATISSAIAKEFGVEFNEAEDRKVRDGLVSLGGAYEDPDDPEIAAISKVIRNTLTRLHAEIVRTTNQYRSQQGGGAPQQVFLCGGSVGLGYAREFFEEKLKLPVEFFNALRTVGVGASVDTEAVALEAHRLGEIVGLALRGAGVCPMEIDLVPAAVDRARDVGARRPYLVTAAVVAFAALGAGILFFQNAEALAQAELGVLEGDRTTLEGWNSKIAAQNQLLEADKLRSAALQEAVVGRTYWQELLSELNNQLPSDLVWTTAIIPSAGGEPVAAALEDEVLGSARSRRGAQGEADSPAIDGLIVRGLYRDAPGGPQDVTKFLQNIAQNSGRFFEVDPEELRTNTSDFMPRRETSNRSDRWAFQYEFRLPLVRKINYK